MEISDDPKLPMRYPDSGGRKAYQPPHIVSREPLEVVAAVCSGAGAKANAFDCDPDLTQS